MVLWLWPCHPSSCFNGVERRVIYIARIQPVPVVMSSQLDFGHQIVWDGGVISCDSLCDSVTGLCDSVTSLCDSVTSLCDSVTSLCDSVTSLCDGVTVIVMVIL
jgi:hypothetical protein